MSSKRIVLAGLVAGFVTIVVVAIVVAAVGPDVVPPASPTPSIGPSTPVSASPSASVSNPASETSGGGSTGDSAGVVSTPGPGDVASGDPGNAFHIGSAAPALDLPQLGGGRIDLAALAGKPVWLEFTTTSSPSSRDDAAAMTSFVERYHPQGLVAIAVDVREDESTVAAFASSMDGAYPIALDTDGAAARTWSVAALPTHFFIDASGIVRAGAAGTVGRDLLASSLGKILPGVTVTP